MIKIKLVLLFLVLASVPIVDAKLDILTLPNDVQVISIFAPTLRENIRWEKAKQYTPGRLVSILQSPQAKIYARKKVSDQWVPLSKEEFIALLQSGNIGQTSAIRPVSTFAASRKPETSDADVGRCKSVFNGLTKESLALRQWKKLSDQQQRKILDNPFTRRHLARCR